EAPILASSLAAEREQREGARTLRRMVLKHENLFEGVELRCANIALDASARLDLGGFTLELHPLAGHTRDQIVAFVPEPHLLFTAGRAEDPHPLVTDGPIRGWPETLENWAARVEVVVP